VLETDSFGLRFSGGVTHTYDLKRATEDAWITNARYAGLRYDKEDLGEYDIFGLETGPSLSLDGEQFGATARPFGVAGLVRSANDLLYTSGGGGVRVAYPLSPETALFGDAVATWREYDEEDDYTGAYLRLTASVAHAVARDTRLRAATFFETDRTEEGYTSNLEIGARVSVEQRLRLGDASFLQGAPTLSAFAQVSGRFFDDADDAVDPDKEREDVDLNIGARLFAPVSGSVGVALDAGYFDRSSNIVNYELDNFEVGASVVVNF
jgi:hypothetical protein